MSDLYIMHYGVGHDKGGHSGRYPWGSGDEPYQDLSAAERRQRRLDKYWYHKGAKIRIGVDHIRDVDPNTKLSDLFKYNKRTTSDVLADKILTYMYGDTEMDREELRRKKYNLMSAITAAEGALAIGALAGGLGGIKVGMDFLNNQLIRDRVFHDIAVRKQRREREELITRNQHIKNMVENKKAGDKARENWDNTVMKDWYDSKEKIAEDFIKKNNISIRQQSSDYYKNINKQRGNSNTIPNLLKKNANIQRAFAQSSQRQRILDEAGNYAKSKRDPVNFVNKFINGSSDAKKAAEMLISNYGGTDNKKLIEQLDRARMSGDLRAAEQAQDILNQMKNK